MNDSINRQAAIGGIMRMKCCQTCIRRTTHMVLMAPILYCMRLQTYVNPFYVCAYYLPEKEETYDPDK